MGSQNEVARTSYDLMTGLQRVEELDRTVDEVLDEGENKNTIAAYQDDWNTWERYCQHEGIPPHAVTEGTCVGFVAWLIKEGYAENTVRRRLTGLRAVMNRANRPIPASVMAKATKKIRQDMKRLDEAGEVRGRGKAIAVTIDELRAMSLACPDTLTGIRDRALLVLALTIGARRHESAGLHVSQIVEVPEGLDIFIRTSKTGPRDVSVPYGQHLSTCPVRAWKAWLAESGLTGGRAFRSISRHGHLGESLTPRAVGDIVAAAAERAGLGKRTAHGLRSGMATAARLAGHDSVDIAPQGGWKPYSKAMTGYFQRADRWKNNPLNGTGI